MLGGCDYEVWRLVCCILRSVATDSWEYEACFSPELIGFRSHVILAHPRCAINIRLCWHWNKLWGTAYPRALNIAPSANYTPPGSLMHRMIYWIEAGDFNIDLPSDSGSEYFGNRGDGQNGTKPYLFAMMKLVLQYAPNLNPLAEFILFTALHNVCIWSCGKVSRV